MAENTYFVKNVLCYRVEWHLSVLKIYHMVGYVNGEKCISMINLLIHIHY